jgi:hypothetical protein
VLTGLILLFFIAAFGAFGLTRVRRRFGMAVNGRVWVTLVLGFAILILVIWVAQSNG